jgi:OOP family OmpA-OmpF porin
MKKLAFGIALTTLTAQALAEQPLTVELLVGQAKQTTEFSNPSSQPLDADDISYGVRGSYRINKNLAAELSYQNFGDAEDKYLDSFGDTITDVSSVTALSLGFKGIAPLNDLFSLVGRVGLSKWDFDVTETDSGSPGFKYKGNDSGSDIYFGLGAEYRITEKSILGLEYSLTNIDLDVDGVKAEHEITNLSLSLGYNF